MRQRRPADQATEDEIPHRDIFIREPQRIVTVCYPVENSYNICKRQLEEIFPPVIQTQHQICRRKATDIMTTSSSYSNTGEAQNYYSSRSSRSGAYAPVQNNPAVNAADPYAPQNSYSNPGADARPFTVTQVKNMVNSAIDCYFSGEITAVGEISNFKIWKNINCYFSLSDGQSTIKCMVRGIGPGFSRLNLRDGMQVMVRFEAPNFNVRGDLSFTVTSIRPIGAGYLEQQLQMLKERLTREGLFDPEHKKQIPYFPKTVGVITSREGDVIHDIYRNIYSRINAVNLILYPATVQGPTAARSLIQQLKTANYRNECDVLIIARGGGSFEDLFCFNDEQLVREIYNSNIPVISAVGHETDFTLCDFVADLRVATPTQAGVLIADNYVKVLNNLGATENFLRTRISDILTARNIELQNLLNRLNLLSPQRQLEYRRTLLQKAYESMLSSIGTMIHRHRLQISNLEGSIASSGMEKNIASRKNLLTELGNRLESSMISRLYSCRSTLDSLSATLDRNSPDALISSRRHMLEILQDRLEKAMTETISRYRLQITELSSAVASCGIEKQLSDSRGAVEELNNRLLREINAMLNRRSRLLEDLALNLNRSNPLTDPRFYKTTTMYKGQALSSVNGLKSGDEIITVLTDGSVKSQITGIEKKDFRL